MRTDIIIERTPEWTLRLRCSECEWVAETRDQAEAAERSDAHVETHRGK